MLHHWTAVLVLLASLCHTGVRLWSQDSGRGLLGPVADAKVLTWQALLPCKMTLFFRRQLFKPVDISAGMWAVVYCGSKSSYVSVTLPSWQTRNFMSHLKVTQYWNYFETLHGRLNTRINKATSTLTNQWLFPMCKEQIKSLLPKQCGSLRTCLGCSVWKC